MESEDRKRSQKTSPEQFRIYLDFLSKYPQLRTGCFTTQQGPQDLEKLWEQLAELLNSCGSGPHKEFKAWKHIFADWKSHVKKKGRLYRAEMAKTGGGAISVKPLTPLEMELLQALGPIVVDGLEGVPELTGLRVPNKEAHGPTPPPPTTVLPPLISVVLPSASPPPPPTELPPPDLPQTPKTLPPSHLLQPPTELPPSVSPKLDQQPTDSANSGQDTSKPSTTFRLRNRRFASRVTPTTTSGVAQVYKDGTEKLVSSLTRVADLMAEHNSRMTERNNLIAERNKIELMKLELEIARARKDGVVVNFTIEGVSATVV